jgi:hypothetical protein
MTPADYDSVPRFVFKEPIEDRRRILAMLAGMACWVGVGGAFVVRRVMRND